MIKLVLLVILVIYTSQDDSSGSAWTSWNRYAANNPTVIQGYSYPSIPYSYIQRYKDTASPPTTYGNRANQYRYTISSMAGVCNIYCGLRSFLTTDSLGYLFCARDTSSQFWQAFGTAYKSKCIPDVDTSYACTIGLANPIFAALRSVGSCDMRQYASSAVYSSSECCYNDNNLKTAPLTDETTRKQSTA